MDMTINLIKASFYNKRTDLVVEEDNRRVLESTSVTVTSRT